MFVRLWVYHQSVVTVYLCLCMCAIQCVCLWATCYMINTRPIDRYTVLFVVFGKWA